MGSALVPFVKQEPETVINENFLGMFSNGWTDLAPGGDWWGANGAWSVFGFGTDVPEARAQKVFSGLTPNALHVVRVTMTWSNASAGDPDVYRFGVWVNDEFGTLPAPGWLGGAAADVTFTARADSAGQIDVKVGGTTLFGSINVIGGFDAVEATTVVGEFADIIIDSAVLIVDGMQLTISRGGWSFDPGEEWEDHSFPGRTMNTKGCRELVSLKPTIKGNAMMTGEAQITAYRPDGTWADHASIAGARTFTPNALRAYLTSSDYLSNVFIVWKRQRGDYIAVEFPTAVCGSYSIGSQDGDEGLIPLTIEAVQDLATGTTKTAVPYRIHTLPSTVTTSDLSSGDSGS